MNIQDCRNHMEDIKDELSLLLFHEQTLIREIELLRPKVESKIVAPKKTTDLRNLTKDDLNIDVVPANLADMETIQARKAFYYAPIELAEVRAAIAAKKEMFNSYKEHIKQELDKAGTNVSDSMIYDAYSKASQLKNITADERDSLHGISENLIKIMNSGPEKRNELYDTLQNLIKQYS